MMWFLILTLCFLAILGISRTANRRWHRGSEKPRYHRTRSGDAPYNRSSVHTHPPEGYLGPWQ
jgi:hypothetical protein